MVDSPRPPRRNKFSKAKKKAARCSTNTFVKRLACPSLINTTQANSLAHKDRTDLFCFFFF
jgi:hypothetical protein